MKIGKTIITIRREVGKTLHDEVDTVLREITTDPTHEFRKLIAHTSRSSAKDFLGTIAEDQLGPLAELVWPLLEPRLIELIKSHTPGAGKPVQEAAAAALPVVQALADPPADKAVEVAQP